MWFDDKGDIEAIARKCGTAIFVVPDEIDVAIKNAIVLEPVEKSVISIEQVRDVIAQTMTRQTDDRFVVIRPAEALSDVAANALLKNLEEPGEKLHFVLITSNPSMLLRTILSRANVFYLKGLFDIKNISSCADSDRELAKRLMVAKLSDLVELAEEITKKKENPRAYALVVVGLAIEMIYKTYLITSKDVFLKKIPKFLAAYDAIEKNGNIKLQIVANLC